MLRWAFVFLAAAIITAIIGFGMVTAAAISWVVKAFTWVFLAAFVLLFMLGWRVPREPQS